MILSAACGWGFSGTGGQELKYINDIYFLAGVGGDVFDCVFVWQLCLWFGGCLKGAETTHSVGRPCERVCVPLRVLVCLCPVM